MAEQQRLNLIQKLAKIRAMSDVVKKDRQGFNYTYADITDILANVTSGMKKYGVSLIPQIVPSTVIVEPNVINEVKFDKTGNRRETTKTEMLVKGDMVFRWVNEEDTSDFIDVPWFLTGSQSDPSQAFGSAVTYMTRYFLTSFFQIAQNNDVDAYRSKQQEAERAEEVETTKEIIKVLNERVNEFTSMFPERRSDVLTLVKKYVKSGDYNKIKEPALASKLLNDFTSTFINKQEE